MGMKPERREIKSPQNPFYKGLKRLLSPKGIKKQQTAVLSGSKIILETLTHHPDRCVALITSPKCEASFAAPPRHLSEYRLTPELFAEMDVAGTKFPLLVVKVPEFSKWDGKYSGAPLLLVPFQDPENVGSVVRSAASFGVDRIVLLKESSHPFHPKSVRASGGTVMDVEFLEGPSLSSLLPHDLLICLSKEGEDLRSFNFPDSFGLLAGVEGGGLPDVLRTSSVSIVGDGGAESLNAAASVAVALYHRSQVRVPQ